MRKLITVVTIGLCAGIMLKAQDPNTIVVVGASADPNGAIDSIQADIGGAKLVGASTYLGAVAHLSKASTPGTRISTKVQFHAAQKLGVFRSAGVYWTAEVGPDFSTMPSVTASNPPSATSGVTVGYAVGSGPLLSIPIGKSIYLMPHAECVKGSLQDLGWRGGVLIGFGSK